MPSRNKTGPRVSYVASQWVAGRHLPERVLDVLVDARDECRPLALHVVAVGLEGLECRAHEALHLRVHRLRESNQAVIRSSSDRHQMVIRWSSDGHQMVIRPSSDRNQALYPRTAA